MYLFPVNTIYRCGYTIQAHGNVYYCINTKPLIRDTFKSSNIKMLSELIPDKNSSKLPDKISELLKKHRYLNYVISELCQSGMNTILTQLHQIVNILEKKYSNKICVYMGGQGYSTLIDTLSISFYRLTDVMPIFDSTHAVGVAMELLFTNSLLTGEEILKDNGNYLILRWLFAQYKDNLFTIDGERIHRNFECSINDTIDDQVYNLLKRSTPDDTALRTKLNQVDKEKNLCAE